VPAPSLLGAPSTSAASPSYPRKRSLRVGLPHKSQSVSWAAGQPLVVPLSAWDDASPLGWHEQGRDVAAPRAQRGPWLCPLLSLPFQQRVGAMPERLLIFVSWAASRRLLLSETCAASVQAAAMGCGGVTGAGARPQPLAAGPGTESGQCCWHILSSVVVSGPISANVTPFQYSMTV
jgi:hypothetical protein